MPDTFEIPNVEIFAAGIWNGDKFTVNDLDKIVTSFNKTKSLLKPFIKIGHSENQNLLKADELPAAGFIENVRRVGTKLVADFKRVPKKIFELIKRRAFSRISSELFVNLKTGGETHPLALKAVAILGGETPAVHSLDDILGLFKVDSAIIAFDKDNKSKEYEIDISYFEQKTEEPKMSEELLRKIGKLEGEVTKFQQEVATATKETEEAKGELEKANTDLSDSNKKLGEETKAKEEAESKVAEVEADKKESEINAEVKGYVDSKKITPYQGDLLKSLLKSVKINEETKEFSIQVGKEEKKFATVSEIVKEFVNSEVDLNEEGQSQRGEGHQGESALIEKAKKYAEEHKVGFSEAIIEVSRDEEK